MTKEKPVFTLNIENKIAEILIEANSLEISLKTYQQLIMSLLSLLRDCKDETAHRSYTLILRQLKSGSSKNYDFLRNWVE